MIVVNQLGIVLMRVATQKAEVTLETAAERPPAVRPGGAGLLTGREMPFPETVGVVAALQQDVGQEPVLERNVAVAARISSGALSDARHRVRMMVAAGEDARPRGRAERGRMHIHEAQPSFGEGVQVRCGDRAAVTSELTEPGIVLHDEEHIRRTLL